MAERIKALTQLNGERKKESSISFHAIISTIFQIPYFQAIEVDLVFVILERFLLSRLLGITIRK